MSATGACARTMDAPDTSTRSASRVQVCWRVAAASFSRGYLPILTPIRRHALRRASNRHWRRDVSELLHRRTFLRAAMAAGAGWAAADLTDVESALLWA